MTKQEEFTSSMAFVKKYVELSINDIKDELNNITLPEGVKVIVAEDKRIHVTVSL
jgi:hypothetical protein